MSVLAMSNLSAGSFTPEQRFAGDSDIITKPMTIAKVSAGAVIPARTVLGRVTASGKLIPAVVGASDGSAAGVAILAEAVDTTVADVIAPVYLAGEFNMDALVYDATFNTEALKLDAFGASGSIIVRKLGYSG